MALRDRGMCNTLKNASSWHELKDPPPGRPYERTMKKSLPSCYGAGSLHKSNAQFLLSNAVCAFGADNLPSRRQNAGLLSIFVVLAGGYYALQYRREKRLQEMSEGKNVPTGTKVPLVRNSGF